MHARLSGLLGLLLMLGGVAHAATSAPACPERMLGLAPWVEVLDDPTGKLTAQQVLDLPATRFQSATARSLVPGISNATWWLRISLENS
ncbi:MAG: 7TMR-DISMED2 domain-containing protein, partial [Rhodanobacter sp.]